MGSALLCRHGKTCAALDRGMQRSELALPGGFDIAQ